MTQLTFTFSLFIFFWLGFLFANRKRIISYLKIAYRVHMYQQEMDGKVILEEGRQDMSPVSDSYNVLRSYDVKDEWKKTKEKITKKEEKLKEEAEKFWNGIKEELGESENILKWNEEEDKIEVLDYEDTTE